ncbi:DNA-binding transcriptional regulator, MerR family [Paenibacillus sophorae]|uniref:DNA-binding transcriptional regulator, MerR family n=1 Tax=Paenibacillus sophorae TaxID=1333845 RepID=A0A1H8THD2_9BACL|nr:MerR family transcriptional regulator [Paenibacillus sophorae]QWU16185.1 MerR family transcriptional regulator [Paenibacillus sophorae]SEO89918.1 DNA-binding transcriptional regulator, MerR family [Paenibacillus sophorae]
MLKISAFSKLTRVSVKTLRFYDNLGLLKPAVVDENNGYRYYTEEQLLTVKRIVALKEQGFTLEQIKPLLEKNVVPKAVKNQLTDKKKELEQAIHAAQNQLNEIDRRLTRMEESEEHYHNPPATIRYVKPQLTASIRDTIPRTQLCLMLDEISQYVRSYGEDEGRLLTILWHDFGSMNSDPVDIEVALPLTKNIPSNGRVKVGILPELKAAASLVHHCNPYLNSCPAVTELMSWISSQNFVYSEKEPVREIYLTSDKDMYGTLRLAELLVPIEYT